MAKLSTALKKLSGKKTGRLLKRWEFDSKERIVAGPFLEEADNGEPVVMFGTATGKVFQVGKNAEVNWVYVVEEKLDEIQKLFTLEESHNGITTVPRFIDVDGDGKKEVVVGSKTGKLYVIGGNGKLKWDFSTKGEIKSTPLVVPFGKKQMILFGSDDGNLYCLNGTGRVEWVFAAEDAIESPPAVIGSTLSDMQIIVGCNSGYIYSISPKGRQLWSFKTESAVVAEPAIGDINDDNQPEIVVGSLDTCLYALNKRGQELWRFYTEGSIRGAAVIKDINGDGKMEIVFGSCDNKVYCLTNEGNELWNFRSNFWIVDSPIVIDLDNDGHYEVAVGSFDGSLYVLDAYGSFLLNYTPGVSQIVLQAGHFSDDITSDPGKYVGSKIWEYKLSDMVVGSSASHQTKDVVVGTKDGKITLISHEKE